MATLVDITQFSKEQQLKIPIPSTAGSDLCMVISGYGIADQNDLNGSDDDDFKLVPYIVRMTVGPDWGGFKTCLPSSVSPAFFRTPRIRLTPWDSSFRTVPGIRCQVTTSSNASESNSRLNAT